MTRRLHIARGRASRVAFATLCSVALAACLRSSPVADAAPSTATKNAPPPMNPTTPPAPATITEAMMEITVRIDGPNGTYGSGFILVKRAKPTDTFGHYVLVTAAHVFTGITGDIAQVTFHQRVSASEWKKLPVAVPIRSAGKPLWTQHPTQDVAVMPVNVPNESTVPNFPVPADDVLATDAILEQIDLRPGDDLFALGFPQAFEANEFGFALMRGGTVASYPLRPMARMKSFFFDFNVWPGNSGGPVFFYNASGTRAQGGNVVLGGRNFAIVGLVSAQSVMQEQTPLSNNGQQIGVLTQPRPFGLALVINATMIDETLQRLPPLPPLIVAPANQPPTPPP